MFFSKACEYAIRASICVAQQSLQNQKVTLKDIAKNIDSPLAFTAKILQKLVRNKILLSTKGPGGGFYIDVERIPKTTLYHIVMAIDGNDLFSVCGLGLKKCSEKQPCPVHDKFKVIRSAMRITLETTSLSDLIYALKDGKTHLKISSNDLIK